MAQFASDLFTGVDGTELTAYNASWTRHTSYTVNSQLVSNRVRKSDVAPSAYYHSGAPASADYRVSVDIIPKEANAGMGSLAAVGRVDTAANTMYMAQYIGDTTDGWQIFKLVAGTFTQLGSTAAQALTADTTYNLKLEMIGSAVKLYKEGSATALITVTDTAITAAGKAGFRFRGVDTPSATTGIHLDNFSADDATTTYTVTATASLAIQKQINAALTAGAAVQKTLTLSSTGSAALQKTQQAIVTASGAIQKTLLASASGTATVQKTLFALSTASAALQKALLISVTAGPHITSSASPTLSTTASAAIQKALTATTTASAAIRKTQTFSATASAAIMKAYSLTLTAGIAVQKTQTLSTIAGAALQKLGAVAQATASIYITGVASPRVTINPITGYASVANITGYVGVANT